MGEIVGRMVWALVALGLVYCAPIRAQEYQPPSPPPVRETIDQNGVDLSRGTLVSRSHSVSIGGAGNLGLGFSRTITSNANFRDSSSGSISVSGAQVTVNFGSRTETFTASGTGVYEPNDNSGSILSNSGANYTYTLADGTIVSYATVANFTMYGDTGPSITTVTTPTGEILSYNYKVIIVCVTRCLNPGEAEYAPMARLQSITATNGYALKFTFSTDVEPTRLNQGRNWMILSKVTAFNMAIDYCDPIADSCSYSQPWPSLTMNYVSSFTDSLNQTTTYTYTSGILTGSKRPGASNNNVAISYDGSGKVSQVVNNGVTTNYSYVDDGGVRTTTISDAVPGNRIVKFDLTYFQILEDIDEVQSSQPSPKKTIYEYNAERLVEKVTAPEGNSVQFAYDPRGNVKQTTYNPKPSVGGTPFSSYAAYPASDTSNPSKCVSTVPAVKCNKPTSTTDPKGNITDYTYDDTHGGVLTITLPAPTAGAVRPQTRYRYLSNFYAKYKNSSGTPVTFATPVTRLWQISQCQETASCINTPDETKTDISYDTNNVLPYFVASGSGNGALIATTGYVHDMVGNRVSIDGPLSGTGDVTRIRYDIGRQVTGVVGPDPDGAGGIPYQARIMAYNADGQQIQMAIGGMTNQTDWTTFSSSQQLNTTYATATALKRRDTFDAGGTAYNVVDYSYTVLNQLECVAMRMDGATWGTQWSDCANHSGIATSPDRISRTVYDAMGRVTLVQNAVGVTGATVDTATTTYSANGKVATVRDARGNLTSYGYDGFDRADKVNYPVATGTPGSSSPTDYQQALLDPNGNVTELRLRGYASDSGARIFFSYDDLNRLVTKDLPGSEPDVTYNYDLLGRMTGASQSGHTLVFTYDALGRNLTQVSPLGTVTSTWDIAGRRTRLDLPGGFYTTYDYYDTGAMWAIREQGAASGVGLTTISYDALGQRTAMTRGNGTATLYAHDPVSRLSGMNQDFPSAALNQHWTYSYNPANQITTRSASNDNYAMRQQYNANRSYNVNGLNQYTTAGSVNPTYDARGNLTGQGTASYAYSVENLLTSATVGSVTTSLAYDPFGRLFQSGGIRRLYDGVNLVAEYDGAGNVRSRYVHGPGTDEPLMWYEGGNGGDSGYGNRRWLHADERGSIVAVSDGSGATIAINAYDEWGDPQSSNKGTFGYTGQTWLSELGLWYYKARMYSPRLGRFMQTDPIGYAGGMNWYGYAGNDPVNMVDPEGLARKCSSIGRENPDRIYVCGQPEPPGREDFRSVAGVRTPIESREPREPRDNTPQKSEPAPEQPKDWCGSGATSGAVPDSPMGINIGAACKVHDECYGNPDKSRYSCDFGLFKDVYRECKSQANVATCSALAFTYFQGVRVGGAYPYYSAQPNIGWRFYRGF